MGISLESPSLTKPLWVGFCYADCNATSWHSCSLSFLSHHGKLPLYKMAFTRLEGPSVTSVPSTYINHLCMCQALALQCPLCWVHACVVGWPHPLLRLGNGAQCIEVHLWPVVAIVSWASVTVSHRLVASEKKKLSSLDVLEAAHLPSRYQLGHVPSEVSTEAFALVTSCFCWLPQAAAP